MCLNTGVSQTSREPWPFFPEQCRSHHPWIPGNVRIYWDACDCPAAQKARGGHIVVMCNICLESWMRPLHQYTLSYGTNYR